MKSYTSIEQSKKLAEFLPFETADMCLNISQLTNMKPLMTPYCKFKEFFNMKETPDFLIPCWSLAALFNVLPKYIGDYSKCLYYDMGHYYCGYMYDGDFMLTIEEAMAVNSVDACYEMILKLHEMELL